VPLLPAHGIRLVIFPSAWQSLTEVYHGSPVARGREPGVAFAAAFRAVWRRLPLGVRRALLRHWRSWPGRPYSRLQIQLSTFRMDAAEAYEADDGFTLRFHPRLDILCGLPGEEGASSESDVESTIAHELAHAYRRATLPDNDRWEEGATEREEVAARELSESWGFPQKPYRAADYRKKIKLEKAISRLRQSRGRKAP
jgi:hypothetical protein